MKRLFSAIILFGMILSFCACGQVDEEIVPDYITSIEEIDFMGVDFLFAQNNSHNSTGDGYMGYLIDTEFSDLAKERIEEVEKKYNVKIHLLNVIIQSSYPPTDHSCIPNYHLEQHNTLPLRLESHLLWNIH